MCYKLKNIVILKLMAYIRIIYKQQQHKKEAKWSYIGAKLVYFNGVKSVSN